MGKKGGVVLLSAALQILQKLAAVFLIIVVPWKLLEGDGFSVDDVADLIDYPSDTVIPTITCLLDPPTGDNFLNGSSFCIAIIAFAVATLVAGIVIACARCICRCASANICGISNLVTIAGDVALAVAWGIAFYLLLQRGQDANAANLPMQGWRNACIATGMVGCLSYVLDAVVLLCALGPS